MQEFSVQKTQVLNFLWLGLDLSAKPDPEDGSIRNPLPSEYIENVREAGMRYPDAQIDFWFDSKRLTARQWDYLKAVIEDGLPNVHIKDLRSIAEYDQEELFNRAETKQHWRYSLSSDIWLQVDAAKILISMQGDCDQRFFADLDHAHLDINSRKVQAMLKKHGLMIGGCNLTNSAGLENQLWGFEKRRMSFFQEYYQEALERAYKGENGYYPLREKVYSELVGYEFIKERNAENCEHIPEIEIVLPILGEGLVHASQPGHEWDGGDYIHEGRKSTDAASISPERLTEVFNAARAGRPVSKTKDIVLAAASASQPLSAKM